MACLLPQDDEIITPLPQPANRPLRVLPGLAVPEQREAIARFGTNCARPVFSVKVEDPNVGDKILALWFIDPIERYIGGVPGPNPGVPVSGEPTIRELKVPSQFITTLGTFTDGRKHRVEVVVTDGDFIESVRNDAEGNPLPFLDITRPPNRIGTGDAGVIEVPAYRDDYVWLVQVDTTPCP